MVVAGRGYGATGDWEPLELAGTALHLGGTSTEGLEQHSRAATVFPHYSQFASKARYANQSTAAAAVWSPERQDFGWTAECSP